MTDNTYKVGQGVTLEFTGPAGDTVTVTVTKPDGTTVSPTATENPAGTYKAAVIANQAGLWWYSGTTSANVAVGAGSFVAEELVPTLPVYALTDLLSAREFVLEDKLDDTQDFRLKRLIGAYSKAVFQYTRREWLPQANSTRSFSYDGSGILDFDPYDLRTVTAVTLYSDLPASSRVTLTAPSGSSQGDWRLEPLGGTAEGTYLRMEITGLVQAPSNNAAFPGYGSSQYFANRLDYRAEVTGSWGIAASLAGVPEDVQLATLIAVADAYRNPEGFATRAFGPMQLTEEASPVPGVSFSAGDLPSESRSLLDPYRARSINLV